AADLPGAEEVSADRPGRGPLAGALALGLLAAGLVVARAATGPRLASRSAASRRTALQQFLPSMEEGVQSRVVSAALPEYLLDAPPDERILDSVPWAGFL